MLLLKLLPLWLVVQMRWFYRAMGGEHGLSCGPTCHDVPRRCTSLLRQNNGRRNTWFSYRRWWRIEFSEVWNNGRFVRLGRCDIVIWCLIAHYYYRGAMTGCVPPAVLHYYLVHDTSTRLLYVPHVSERKYRIHESERRWMSTRYDLVFAASRDPSIQTQTKKRWGRVFSRAAGRGVWHSLFEATRQEGKQANKGWVT